MDTFAYNGLGLRVAKADSTGTYSSVCDGTTPGSPVLSDGHTTFTAGLSSTVAGVTAFRHEDLLGSLRFLTNSRQSVTGSGLFEAFGAPVGPTGTTMPFGFVGGSDCQTDADTGLVLMGHRYYDSRIGRFISQDPAGDGDNWYSYAGNDPVNGLDPEGLYHELTDGLHLPGHWSDDDITNYLLTNDYAPGTYDVSYTYRGEVMTHSIDLPGMAADGMGGMGTNMGHNSMFAGLVFQPDPKPESLGHYLLRQFLSGGQADGSHLGPPAGGLFGQNPNVTPRQTNTNAAGGRPAAKSLFRKLSKGQEVIEGKARDGSIRRYTKNGSVQIRMKADGTTNVDIQGVNGKEDVHFDK